jgi:hypothetical protein
MTKTTARTVRMNTMDSKIEENKVRGEEIAFKVL